MQGFSSKSSRTERFHELQIPGTLGRQTWAKWVLPLGLFVGLAWQSAWLWGRSYGMSTTFPPLTSAAATLPASADAANVRFVVYAAIVFFADSTDELP